MTKTIFIFYCIFWTVNVSGQTCSNPDARLRRLNLPNTNADTIYRWVKNDLALLQINQSDTIADIGSYDGYYPMLYSVFSDSAVFYLNDIKSEGFAYMDSIRNLCVKFKGQNISNKFIVVIGHDTSTNLSNNMFDKVIIRDALHHFKSIDKMLVDVKRIIKEQGQLILFEPVRKQDSPNENMCAGAMTKTNLLEILNRHGFQLLNEIESKNSFSWFKFVLTEK
ncbi:MAG: class I SAM-dependent methyltransferase [Bacteroidota bacterium]